LLAQRIGYALFCVGVFLAICVPQTGAARQTQKEASASTSSPQDGSPPAKTASLPPAPSASATSAQAQEKDEGKQPKRILGIIPN
jgi:hypothetical protein